MSNRKYMSGITVAVIIISVIYIPLSNATAFTIGVDFSDDDGTISQSAQGENFEAVITVNSNELISISEIHLILDNSESSMKRTTFDSDGDFSSGDNSLIMGNELNITGFSNTGFGYGFGLISDGFTFVPPNSYTITPSLGYIGGNTLGYTTGAGGTNFVTGLVGPGEITISGTIRTATLADGAHTLDVLIDTGAGGNNVDQLSASTFNFTVEEDDSVVVAEEPVTAGEQEVEIDTTNSDGDPITVGLEFDAPTTTTGNAVVIVQNVDDFAAGKTATELAEQGFTQSGSQLTYTTDDTDTTFIAAGFILDIDISALGLPDGTEVTLNMDYDDTGLSGSEENSVRLMHQLDTLTEWEALTNDDPTINGGNEVDTTLNIVYGTTNDFSLFGPAVATEEEEEEEDDDDDSGGGGGGGGGRSVVINWPPERPVTFPESHFANFPLERIQVASSAFLNAQGLTIAEAQVNQQVSVSGEFTNYQEVDQNYAFIVQVLDENGIATDINWQQSIIASGETSEISVLWTPQTEGDYTVRIFVWDGVSGTPTPLSEVTVKNISVSAA